MADTRNFSGILCKGGARRAGGRYRTGALLAMRAKVLTSIAVIVRGGPIPKVGKSHLKGILAHFYGRLAKAACGGECLPGPGCQGFAVSTPVSTDCVLNRQRPAGLGATKRWLLFRGARYWQGRDIQQSSCGHRCEALEAARAGGN